MVTLDAGDWNDLHPWNKSVVADRLFAAAQRLVYGKDDAPRSPEPTGVRLADGRLTIAFDDGTGDAVCVAQRPESRTAVRVERTADSAVRRIHCVTEQFMKGMNT